MKKVKLLAKKDLLVLFFLFFFNLIFRLRCLGYPREFAGDEAYYIKAARDFLKGLPDPNICHPPLGKMFIGLGIFLFGDNPFGWRIFSVLSGMLGIVLIYLLAKKIFKGFFIPFVTAFFLSLEPLYFLHSQIAMLDIFLAFFSLVAVYLGAFYWQTSTKKKAFFLGFFIGLAGSVKLSGFFLLIPFLVWFFLSRKRGYFDFLLVCLGVFLSFFLSYSLFFIQEGFLSWPSHLIKMVTTGVAGNFSNIKTPPPINWLLNWGTVLYYSPTSGQKSILGFIHPLLLFFSLPSVLGNICFAFHKKDFRSFFPLIFFSVFYFPWFFVSRPVYLFYLLPALPFICLTEAIFLKNIIEFKEAGKIFAAGFLLLFILVFIVNFPFFVVCPVKGF